MNPVVAYDLALWDADLTLHLFGDPDGAVHRWPGHEVGHLAFFLDDSAFDPPSIEMTGGWA